MLILNCEQFKFLYDFIHTVSQVQLVFMISEAGKAVSLAS